MESTTKKNILALEKTPCDAYKFFLNLKDDTAPEGFLNFFIGETKLPLIGHYNHNEYTFGSILSIVSLNFDICQGDNNEIKIPFQHFSPCESLLEYLNVNKVLEVENHSKAKNNQSVFIPQQKVDFYFIVSSLPGFDASRGPFVKFNVVPHAYLLGDSVFSGGKTRIAFNYPISIFEGDAPNNTIEKSDGNNNIQFNDLRFEYSSAHLKKGGLAFSPNNLLFKINTKEDLSNFYLVMCLEQKKAHSVFYYITCNNKKSEEKMKNILETSKNINDICTKIKSEFPSSKSVVENLNSLFN